VLTSFYKNENVESIYITSVEKIASKGFNRIFKISMTSREAYVIIGNELLTSETAAPISPAASRVSINGFLRGDLSRSSPLNPKSAQGALTIKPIPTNSLRDPQLLLLSNSSRG